MSTHATDVVRRSVTVQRPVDEAFRLFTEGIATWWPIDSHSIGRGDEPPETVVMEGGEGGRLYERMRDGNEANWGTILAWEPPHRIVLSWELRPGRPATEIEVRFSPEAEGTRVELEHRGWERLGAEAEAAKASYRDGWAKVLGNFAEAANS
jgi:uncharacterized protein YndB with AHSA1/START domain